MAYIYAALLCGALAVAGSVAMAAIWMLVLLQVQATRQHAALPWWATRAGRGW